MLSMRAVCASALIWCGTLQGVAATTGVDLGVASYPDPGGARSMSRISVHRWMAPTVTPELHRLGYALADSERKAIESRVAKFVIDTDYKTLSFGDSYQIKLPTQCERRKDVEKADLVAWCVYSYFAAISEPSIWPLARRLIERIHAGHLSGIQSASLLLSFVQEIPYKKQTQRPFDLLAPSLVAYEQEADCDSKALLAHMLFTAAGIPTVLLTSRVHVHAILGISVAALGQSRNFRGTRYALAETTSKWPIGYIDPRFFRPDDWRVIQVYNTSQKIDGNKR